MFQAYKKSLDGMNTKWGFVINLSVEDVRDTKRFPGGKQKDPTTGQDFAWVCVPMQNP